MAFSRRARAAAGLKRSCRLPNIGWIRASWTFLSGLAGTLTRQVNTTTPCLLPAHSAHDRRSASDIDLHVKEPTGEEVYYSHNRSATTGGAVSRDFTQGYGPEVYTLAHAPVGNYSVRTNYYGSHQYVLSFLPDGCGPRAS